MGISNKRSQSKVITQGHHPRQPPKASTQDTQPNVRLLPIFKGGNKKKSETMSRIFGFYGRVLKTATPQACPWACPQA